MAANISQPLYLITDGGQLRSKGRLVTAIEEALVGADGLIGYVQFREFTLPNEIHSQYALKFDLHDNCFQLSELCRRYGAKFILNSACDLDFLPLVDGIHCGKSRPPLEDVSAEQKNRLIIGYSAHDTDEAVGAFDSGFNYVHYGPVFKPNSKPSDRVPVGLNNLADLTRRADGLVFALGGIDESNVAQCRRAGASGIAAIGTFLFASSPRLAAKKLADQWLSAA